MAKRMFLMLGVTALLLTALGFVKFKQVQSAVHSRFVSTASGGGHERGRQAGTVAGDA